MDRSGQPLEIVNDRPTTPWGARILLGLVALLFVLVALACDNTGGVATPTAGTTPPTIQSFTPSAGIAGETLVTLTGTGLSNFTQVRFGTVAAAQASNTDDTTITVRVPDGAVTGPITVVTPLGSSTTGSDFTVTPKPPQVPVVNTFQPPEGQVDTLVTLTGVGFTGATEVSFGGVASTGFTVAGGTSIQARVPAGAQTGPLSVRTANGIHVTDASFTVLPTPARHHLPPAVTAFTPGRGGPGTPVVVTGSRFLGASQVAFNGRAAFTFVVVNDQELQAWVPMGATTGPITVTTTGGNGTSTDNFVVEADPPGSITGFTLASGAPGSLVVITGTGLTGATEVAFGGVTTIPEDGGTDTGLLVQVPAGAVSGPLAVFTPTGILLSDVPFTVLGATPAPTLPTLTGATPAQSRPGTLVTLQGTGLGTTRRVYFSNAPAILHFVGDDNVVAEVPDAASDGRITVVTAAGIAQWQDFHVLPPLPVPVVTGFTPDNGAPGTPVTLSGDHLEGAIQVTFGGVRAASYSQTPGGPFIAFVPADAADGPIAVATDAGIGRSTSDFHPLPAPPVASGYSPNELEVQGVLSIQGTGLSSASGVVFTGANSTQVIQDRFITFRDNLLEVHVPAEAVSGPIALLYHGTSLVLSGPLTVRQAAPVLRTFYPARAIHGQLVTLSGTGLNTVETVTIGGQQVDPRSWSRRANGTEMSVQIPDGIAPGDAGLITVAGPQGSAVSSRRLTVVPSRRDALQQVIPPGVEGLLDFPGPRRAAPYQLQLPQAPVFHPAFPTANLLPNNTEPSRPDQPRPHFTLNFLLTDAFFESLPERMQALIYDRNLRDRLQIMVVSQHNVWNSDPERAGYQVNRDAYEFKPQYWRFPNAPAQSEAVFPNTALLQVALFDIGLRSPLNADRPSLNGGTYGVLSDPVRFNLGTVGMTEVRSYFGSDDRLFLENLDYHNTYGFWTLTLADTAVATLHLLVNDDDQAALDTILATGGITNLGQFAAALGPSASPELRAALSSLVRPRVGPWHREPQGVPGVDRIDLEGDLFTGVTGVTWFDREGKSNELDRANITPLSDARLRLSIPREAVNLVIRTNLGVSDLVEIDGTDTTL